MSEALGVQCKAAEAICDILKDLIKVTRVVSMYPEDNPLPQSMRQSFGERLESVVAEHGEIRLSVEKDRLTYCGESVFSDSNNEDSLARLFFDAGITTCKFKDNLSFDEIQQLLDLFKKFLNSPGRAFDLTSGLWESGIRNVEFSTLEDVELADYGTDFHVQEFMGDGEDDVTPDKYIDERFVKSYRSIFEVCNSVDIDEIDDDDSDLSDFDITKVKMDENLFRAVVQSQDESIPSSSSGTFRTQQPGQPAATDQIFTTPEHQERDEGPDASDVDGLMMRAAESADALGVSADTTPDRGGVNTSVILNDQHELSEDEEEHVRRLVENDAEFDMWESTTELIKELLHQETDLQGFGESVGIAERVIDEFVRHGHLHEAGALLGYLSTLQSQISGEKPRWAQRLNEATVTVGSREYIRNLTEALNEHESIGADELRRYLDHFGWEALNGITDMLGGLEHRTHREALCDYLTHSGKDSIRIVSKGIYDKRWFVVRNSVTILARMGDPESLIHLSKVLDHEERRVRLALVTSLKESPSDQVLTILAESVKDDDSEVRREAIQSIASRRGQKAFDTISAIVQDEWFKCIGQDDQQMLLDAYSRLGGEYAVEYLGKLIMAYNPFRNDTLSNLRNLAFGAMSKNLSEKGEKLLLKLSNSWRPSIKRGAVEAIKKRRGHMFGGDND